MSPPPAASAAGRARPKRFRSPAWARFRANRRGWWSLRILCALYALSLCAELLCNDRPLVLRVRGRTFFPALSSCTQDELLGDGVRRPVRDFAPILARPDARALLAPFPSGAHTVFEPSALDAHLRPVSSPAAHWPVAACAAAPAPDGAGAPRWSGAPWGDADRFAAALAAPPPAALRAALEARVAGRAAPAFECAEGGVSFRLPPSPGGRPEPAARVYLRTADWRTAPPETEPGENAAPLEPAAFPFRPIPGHPFGFDEAGRDVFAQVLYGTRTAITFGLLLTLASLLLGIAAGAVQGWFVRWVDVAGQRLTEIWSALPFLYVMILLGNEFGRGFGLLLVCYALFNWIGTASYVRAEFLRLRTRAFADAARVQGLGAARIMFRHLLPNALTPLITLFPFLLVGAIGSLAALDYLGFGLPEDAPSWGNLLRQAQAHRHAWWLILFPSLALFAVMLLGVFVGEGLRDAFDPRPVTALDDPRVEKARRRRRGAAPDADAPAPGAPLLEIDGLRVSFDTPASEVRAVDGVSLSLAPGETLGLVGESGCGKSVTAMSVLRLVPSPPGRVVGGSIRFEGRDLATLPLRELRKIRGAAVGMVFQDPMTALSPLHRIGDQLLEAIRLHRPVSRREGLALAERWLARCGIADPKRCLREYPFRLSGGMQQRVMIASVLMTDPRLIIADEPTTALDVTVQAQVLELMRSARDKETALLLITHNMAVVRSVCSRVAVMYAGRIVESGPVEEVFANPRHPYTAALLAAMPGRHAPGERLPAIPGSVPSPLRLPPGCRFAPRCARATERCAAAEPAWGAEAQHGWACLRPLPAAPEPAPGKFAGPQHETPARSSSGEASPASPPDAPLLSARSLFKRYPHVTAVSDVSLDLRPGETLAVVGESGSGKTTLARLLAGLEPPSSGELLLDGRPLRFRRTAAQRRDLQMVFQDPFSSLNPRHCVADLLSEAPRVHGLVSRAESRAFALRLLERVGLPPEAADRFPHEFSGGQLQRISIARALALRPRILLCDEPVSALDVSVQAQILNLLADLREEFRPAVLFITHDLGVVRSIADRVLVLHQGAVVEEGPAARVLADPQDPYTRRLLAAEPRC